MNKRNTLIDYIRALAIILMIIFHFSHNLMVFNLISFQALGKSYWTHMPHLIISLFFFCVGYSFWLSHQNFNKEKYLRRLVKISLGALLVTLYTYFFYYERWVYFGVLHCIALSSVFILPFYRHKWINFILFLALFLLPALNLYKIPFFVMNHKTMDYVPLFPWIGIIFLGIFSAQNKLLQFQGLKDIKPIYFLNKHALTIYLIHLPLIYWILYIFIKIK